MILLFLEVYALSLANSPAVIKLEEQFVIAEPENIDIGYVCFAILNGEEFKATPTAKGPDGLTWINSNGCITKQQVQFAFPILWRNCEPFVDGTASVEYGGKIWPLETGR